MAQPIRIIYVRHGETDWNAEGRLQGQQEIPINATGRHQAAEAGRKLGRLGVSPGTAEAHFENAARKLGVRGRTRTVIEAYRRGEISI